MNTFNIEEFAQNVVNIEKEAEIKQFLEKWNKHLKDIINYLIDQGEMEMEFGQMVEGNFVAYKPAKDFWDGTPSEIAFYEAAVQLESIKPLVVQFLTELEEYYLIHQEYLWQNSVIPLGLYPAYFLSLAYEDCIPLFFNHLNTVDLGHSPIDDIAQMALNLRTKWGTGHAVIEEFREHNLGYLYHDE